VRADDDLATRIASALPARASRFGWLVPQFAAIAAVALAAGVWMLRGTSTPSLSPLPSSQAAAVMTVPNPVVAREPGTAVRTQPLAPLEPLEPLERSGGADHERSLASIEAMTALVVADVAPVALSASPLLEVAPLDIADLKMTAESFSPR
jgi:hypothetical protein